MKKSWKSPDIECLNIAMTKNPNPDKIHCISCYEVTNNNHVHGAQKRKCNCCKIVTPDLKPGILVPMPSS